MKEDEIMTEIRRIREEHARAHNFDIDSMFEEMRRETEQLKADGWKVVDFSKETQSSCVVREEPSKPGEDAK